MTDRASPRVVKRSLVIAGHRTSVSLEDAFWRRLYRIAAEREISVNAPPADAPIPPSKPKPHSAPEHAAPADPSASGLY